MLDGRVLEASQVEYKPFGKPLYRESHVLALGAHLDGALQLALSSVRAAPGKGFWKMIMLSMTPCSTSSVHSSRSVLLAKHTLGPVHVHLAHQRALMGVLYGHELSPLGIGLNVQPECKLHCSAPFFIRVFIVQWR